MFGDKLVIALEGARLAIDTSYVAGIVEVDGMPFLPGRTGFVSGVISLRNEPVAVIDLKMAFSAWPAPTSGTHRVIVVRDKSALLGLDAGEASISFFWAEELKACPFRKGSGYIKGEFDTDDGPLSLLDWKTLFEETARILHLEGTRV